MYLFVCCVLLPSIPLSCLHILVWLCSLWEPFLLVFSQLHSILIGFRVLSRALLSTFGVILGDKTSHVGSLESQGPVVSETSSEE